MKKILLIFVGIALVLLISANHAKESQTAYSTDSDKVYLMMTENTTDKELEEIAKEFKKTKNIIIDFSKSTFNSKGQIKSLDLVVNCNDGFNGNAKLSGLILNVKNFGFTRDFTKNTFFIGSM